MSEEEQTNQDIEKEEIIIEKEWNRIERLLVQSSASACNMSIIEADKLFREVLGIMSFGDTAHEAIQNASDVFSDMKALLEARKVYEDIVEVPGFFVDKKVAKQVTAIYLQAILDMMGKDYKEKSSWHKFINELAFFGESNPGLIRNIFAGILLFLISVWFLSDTSIGQWLVELAVGLTHFVLNWLWWLVLVLIVVLVVAVISWLFFEGRRK